MKPIQYFTMILSVVFITGCGTVKKLEEGAHLASYKADKRGSLIVVKDGKTTMLSEVQPDAIISSVMNFTNNIDIEGKFTADQAVTITEAVTSLGERTEAVNILRDALYRLAEMRSQRTIDPETERLFCKIIESAETIALADKTKREAELKEATAEVLAQENILKNKLTADEYVKIKKAGN